MRRIDAAVCREVDGALAITYVIEGDLDRVRVPQPGTARIADPGIDPLWQHTCCEAFVRCDGSPGYHEFNFAPSGSFAAYAFERYRENAPELPNDALRPQLTVRATAAKLELDAVIRLALLSPAHASATLVIGLSAVVEEHDGRLSYWALRHPPGKPDFHHPDAFALELPC